MKIKTIAKLKTILLVYFFFASALFSNPDLEIKFFSDWNQPYGNILPPGVLAETWRQIHNLPSENDFDSEIINQWRLIGPYGSTAVNSNARFTGRILDIDVGNTQNPVVASASGGLWSYLGILPYPLSKDLNSLVCGAFAIDPVNSSNILLGTGEPSVRGGTGLYRSTNSGNTWTQITMPQSPSGFYKIKHQGFISTYVHLAATTGYYRSTNNGLNWVRTLDGNITDFDFNPVTPSTIYAAKRGDGIYKSTNGGINWTKVTTPGIPTTNVGRTSVTMGISNSSKIAVCIARENDDNMLGIYVSDDDGSTWSQKSPPSNILGNQGWYNNTIAISPANSNLIIAGGVTLWRSTNFGNSWTQIDDDDVHADQHEIEWSSNGTNVYVGNDGGLSVSTDQGATFITTTNYFPITQYVNFDIGVSNRGVIYGGSQDNGITGTTNGGLAWLYTLGGDGGGVAIDPFSSLYIYVTRGYLLGNWAFKRYKSTNQGLSWTETNTGVDPSDQWYTKIRSDRNTPMTLYHNSSGYIYTSADNAGTWSKLNNNPFPSDVRDFAVTKYSPSGTVVYAVLSSDILGQRLRVYDGGSFTERTSGIPSGIQIRKVTTDITNNTTAYALINGFSAGEKVFKTTNKGVNWTNISGNLPDLPLGDILPHPTDNNRLYLGTQMGCYRTTDAGSTWHRWNNGLPEAAIVTEFKWIDSTIENGRFYIAAGTYGSSIWVRDISGDDPIGVITISNNIPQRFSLQQNYPNPFNPSTNIAFELPVSSKVKLTLYDIQGRVVEVLVNEHLKPGSYRTAWNGAEHASGIYLYKLEADGFSETKKLMLVK